MNYTELINRIEELKGRKGRGSITVDETFSLLKELAEKTKAIDINAGSLTIRSVYASTADMNADMTPIDTETFKPLRAGQLVCICNLNDLSGPDNGKIYRYNKPGWGLTSQVGDMIQFAKTKDVDSKFVKVEQNLKQLGGTVITSNNVLSPDYYLNGAYISSKASLCSQIQYNDRQNEDGSYQNMIALLPVEYGNSYQVLGWRFTAGRINASVLEMDEELNVLESTYFTGTTGIAQVGLYSGLNYSIKNTKTKVFAFEIRNGVYNNILQDTLNTIYVLNNKIDYNVVTKDEFEIAKIKPVKVILNSDNLLNINNCVGFNSSKAVFEYTTIGGEWLTILGYDSTFLNAFSTVDDFFEYDMEGNVLNKFPLKDTNQKTFRYIKLNENTKKIKLQILNSKVNPTIKLDLNYIVNNIFLHIGNKPFKSFFGNYLQKVNGADIHLFSQLRGKIVLGLGDSIMDFGSASSNGSWLDFINAKTEAVVYNYAKGNATLCNYTDETINPEASSNTVIKHLQRAITDGIVPDIVFINGGVNDIARSRTTLPGVLGYGELSYGEIDFTNFPNVETNNTHQVYPALQFIIAKLREVNPFVKIYLVTHIRALPHETVTIERLKAFRQAFFNVSQAYSIDIIDMWQCGIMEYPKTNNPYFNTNGVSDQIHPSQFGVNLMGAMAFKKLETTYFPVDDSPINYLSAFK